MRTTVTLDPDVRKLLEEAAHVQRRSFKAVLNDAIRRGLGPGPRRSRKRYRAVPHHSKLRPGVDSGALNRLADELEDEAAVGRLDRG